MAKGRSRRKRDPNFVALKVQQGSALGALANDTATVSTLIDFNDDLYLISSDLSYAIHGLTAGEGPIEVGLNSSAMTEANIVEALDASPTSRADPDG